MITTSKMLAIVAAAFVAGSFVASPELRAFAANTVGSTDIINESIMSEDIKNSQVKASDIAVDAVGASEIQGVSKLLFAECKVSSSEASILRAPDAVAVIFCSISGVDNDDNAIASLEEGVSNCFALESTLTATNLVRVNLRNNCDTSQIVSLTTIGIIVYDK